MPDNEDDGIQRFPIEEQLMNIATISNVYILAVLDCCRTKMGTRGPDQENKDSPLPKNLILIQGCPPGKTVLADSILTVSLISKLKSFVKTDNSLVLPG